MKKIKIYLYGLGILIVSILISWVICKLRANYEFIRIIDPIYHLWLFGPAITSVLFFLGSRQKGIKTFGFVKPQNLGILFYAILIMILTIIISIIIQYNLNFIVPEFNPNRFILFNYKFTPAIGTIIIIFLLLIHAGFAEEILWRGFLYNKLSELSWLELIITLNTIWAVWHFPFMPFNQFLQYLLFWILCIEFGTILIYVRLKTGSVISSMLLHTVVVSVLGILFAPYFKINNGLGAGWPNYILAIILLPISIVYFLKGNNYYKIKKAH